MHHFSRRAVNYLFLPSICIGLGIADAKWQNILKLQAVFGSDGMHRPDIDGLRAVAVVSVCNPECMIWAEEGVPLQFDDGHLTRQGSAYVAREFGRQVL